MLRHNVSSSDGNKISHLEFPSFTLSRMPSVNIPISNYPPFSIAALALLTGADLKWDLEATDAIQVVYEGITGVEPVRAALEAKLPGKEVR